MFDDIGININVKLNGQDAKTGLKSLEDQIKSLDGKTINIGTTKIAEETQETLLNFKKLGKNIKQFAFSLLTVRGIWFGIRKAMTVYLSQNDELKSKLNGIYYAMGSMFAPVLEWMVNMLAYGLYIINEIVKALGFAGINMDGLGKSTGSTAKKMKALLGMDEINNLTTSSGGGGTKIGNPFEDIDTNAGIFQALEKIKPLLKEIGNLIKTSFTITSKLISGEPITKDELKFKLIESLGLLGLGAVFMAIDPKLGIVLTTVGLLDLVYTLKNAIDNSIVLEDGALLKAILAGLGLGALGAGAIALGATATGLVLTIAGAILFTWSISNLFGKKGSEWKGSFGLENQMKIANDQLFPNLKQVPSQSAMGISGGGGNVGGGKRTIPLDDEPRYIMTFATGTNYVPNDQLAYIHKGEAIVPKEFNPSAFYGNATAEELNLLASINAQLEQLNRKNVDINIDGRNVAQAINNHIIDIQQREGQRVFALGR